MWFSLLYEIGLFFVFLAFLPKALYECLRYKKHRSNLFKRLSFDFPLIQRKSKDGPIIWVHCVSVGECHAASPLVKRLQADIPTATVIVSSVSETGHAEAKKAMPTADYHVYLPFDFYFCVKRVINAAKPDFVILCEGDFWYRFLKEAKKQGAIAIVVNGKISSQSQARFKQFGFFTKRLFSLIDYLCVQSDLYKQRFLHLGIASAKISATGNLKCDSLPTALPQHELDELKAKLHLQPEDKVLVIGSTHDPEEELFFSQLVPLLAKFPELKLIVAPRHPERFSLVATIIEKYGLSYGTWTKGSPVAHPQAFLIDAMGILRKCYQLADIAIVAGSFTKRVGGHNIMEAQAFGVPVISGPYMHSQPQLIECAKYYNAILQIDETEIATSIELLLNEPKKRQELGNNALNMVSAMRGATDRTFQVIHQLAPQFFACNKAL